MDKKVRLVTVGGFLGAGKTTTILKAIDLLKSQGIKAVYITNDQGEGLVDTALGHLSGVAVGEVVRGCFCCRFEELVATVMHLIAEHQPRLIFAEAVGSCADLIATVIRPLKQDYGEQLELAPYTVIVDPIRHEDVKVDAVSHNREQNDSVAYLFTKQLEEAQVIALNKVDLISHEKLAQVQEELNRLAPSALLIPYSAHLGVNLDKLIAAWLEASIVLAERPLDIDYDVYAEAEAQLAWVNMTVQVLTKRSSGFYPEEWLQRLLRAVGDSVVSMRATIGHVKVQMNTAGGVTKASLVRTGADAFFTLRQETAARTGQVFVNARVETDPDLISKSLEEAIEAADDACETHSMITQREAFRPPRPQPTHRFVGS